MSCRLSRVIALLLLLAGPLGLLGMDHAALHGDHHGPGHDTAAAPCPVCHFLTTVSIDAPAPAPTLPAPAWSGVVTALPAHVPGIAPSLAPARSRAPPALS